MKFLRSIKYISVFLAVLLVFSGCDSLEEDKIQEIYNKVEEAGGELTDEITEIIQNAVNSQEAKELLVQEETLITEENIQGITSLDISIGYSDVEIVKGDSFNLAIYNYKSQIFDSPMFYRIEDDKLIIRQEENKIINIKRNAYSSGEGQKSQRAVITVPENYSFDVVSISAMGDVSAPELSADTIITDVNYGTVNFNDCTAQSASMAVKYGDGTAKNLNVKELDLYSAYSELDFSNDSETAYVFYRITLDYTDIKLSNIDTSELVIKGMYGEAELSDITTRVLRADASYTDITLNNVNAENVDYRGLYSDFFAENLMSAGIEAEGKYCNFYLQGNIKGKNEISNAYGTIQLDTQQKADNCYIDIKLKYGEAKIFSSIYDKSVSLGEQSAEYSFIINSTYCDVEIF